MCAETLENLQNFTRRFSESLCHMTPESRNSEDKVDVYC
jgi:hypothetical protein